MSYIGAHPRDVDGGADGILTLVEGNRRQVSKAIGQVKGTKEVQPEMIRALIGTVENENAAMGLFITLAPPTKGMVELATHSGVYVSPVTGLDYQKIQIRTIKELIEENKSFDLPPNVRPV